MSCVERVGQRIRYFPWWVAHPIQYHHSERLRRAVNLIAQMMIDDDLDGGEVGLPNEQEGYLLYARIERYAAPDYTDSPAVSP